MRFGVNFTPVPPDLMAALARRAEERGFESLWIGEHVLVPFGAVPERDLANFKPTSRFVEPWVTLADLAAVTTTVRLGTCVAVMPMHSPVHLARSIATLDVLSGGRVSVGVGVGVIEEEYRAVHEDFATRGARLDEQLAVLEVLFNDDRPEFHGRFYDFPPSGFEPKPIQRPHPPLLIGGGTPAGLRRTLEWGDGWFGVGSEPGEVADVIGRLQQRRAAAQRDPLEVTLLAGWARGYDADLTARFAAARVDRLVVTPWSRSSQALDGLERFATEAGLS